jgi:hypothetical protein
MVKEPRKRQAVARGRKNADETLLTALACGATVENAARTAGIGTRTAYRRLKEEGFHQRLRDLRLDMVQRTGGMLTASGMEAVKTLISLQDASVSPAVRLGAARTLLEFGIKLRENGELAERVAALEAQAGQPAQQPPEASGRD